MQAPTNAPKCGVCNENESKYRCSKCKLMRYCSVACYKAHTAEPCVLAISTTMSDTSGAGSTSSASGATSSGVASSSAGSTTSSSTSLSSTSASASASSSEPIELAPGQVHPAALEALRHSQSIRSALTSTELRRIITQIDSASSEKLRIAMLSDEMELNPHFLEFIEEVMLTVEKAEKEVVPPSASSSSSSSSQGPPR